MEDAADSVKASVLLVALDRETCAFGLLQGFGLAFLGEIKGSVAKKRSDHIATGDFFVDGVAEIRGYIERYSLSLVVVGSPAFWKDELLQRMSDDLRKKVVLSSCHAVGKAGLYELLKRDEVKKALSRQRMALEVGLVEQFLAGLRKDPATVRYGLVDVTSAVALGAVSVLLVTDKFVSCSREEVDSLLAACEKTGGEVHIVSSSHDAGAQVDGLGGVVCLLRYRLE